MEKIGVSLHVGTLLNTPETEAQAALQKEYGGAAALLAYLRREGVCSIEVRNVREHMPVAQSVAAIRAVHEAGLGASIHIAFEERAGREYAARVRTMIDEALRGQERVVFTLHPLKNDGETAARYADWAAALHEYDGRCRLALENMRVLKPDAGHNRIARVAQNIRSAPEAARGVCWDMGHYAYNIVTLGLPAETCPVRDILGQVIHTHIHSLHHPELDTHFPLQRTNEPVKSYLAALRAAGYQGIYNIELEPERYIRVMSPRAGMEQTVSVLKEWLE